jgi:D-3-phosphoglycerate dehydrogenase
MTKGELGYAITDIRTDYTDKLIKELKEIENTIKFRLIY